MLGKVGFDLLDQCWRQTAQLCRIDSQCFMARLLALAESWSERLSCASKAGAVSRPNNSSPEATIVATTMADRLDWVSSGSFMPLPISLRSANSCMDSTAKSLCLVGVCRLSAATCWSSRIDVKVPTAGRRARRCGVVYALWQNRRVLHPPLEFTQRHACQENGVAPAIMASNCAVTSALRRNGMSAASTSH